MTGAIVPIGIGTAPLYPRLTSAGSAVDTLADPGDTNPPIVFEPPPALSGGDLEVWLIASGGADWGGCQVWVSSDNTTYALAGTIYRGGRQGTLVAGLASHADPDTANTLSVDLSESAGQLLSGTQADADNLVTLCYCDGELVSYETATLTAAHRYDLTYLRRGVYGTPVNAHATGSRFARFGPNDPSLFRYRYPRSFVGQTVYIKLPAFNTFGQSLQDLSGLVADSYTLTGAGRVPANIPFTYIGTSSAPDVEVAISFGGTPAGGAAIVNHTFGSSASFPASLAGSRCTAGAAPTADTVFDVARNGTGWGTMTFAAAATSATFAGGPEDYAAGDVLTITPRSTDATLADLTGVLVGAGASVNSGTPQAGSPIVRYTFDAGGGFAANMSGSAAGATVAATAAVVFDIALNGSNFATMTFAAGAASATFAGAARTFIAGDVLTVTPDATDATLADISGYLTTA